jgi:hypothetical protein
MKRNKRFLRRYEWNDRIKRYEWNDRIKRYEWNDTNETNTHRTNTNEQYEWNDAISRRRPETGLNLSEYWHENPEFGFVPLCCFIRSFHLYRFIRSFHSYRSKQFEFAWILTRKHWIWFCSTISFYSYRSILFVLFVPLPKFFAFVWHRIYPIFSFFYSKFSQQSQFKLFLHTFWVFLTKNFEQKCWKNFARASL